MAGFFPWSASNSASESKVKTEEAEEVEVEGSPEVVSACPLRLKYLSVLEDCGRQGGRRQE